jgi:hypothetical protein
MKTLRRRTLLMLTGVILGAVPAVSGCGGGLFVSLGTAIDILPSGFVTVTVGTTPFYYHRGIFYRSYRRGYVVVPAPIGAVVGGLPPGAVTVLVENDPFVYYRGVFYAGGGGRYRVVRAPMGAFVRNLTREAVTVRIGGVEYKEYAGVYYRPSIREGRRGYEVSEPPRRR